MAAAARPDFSAPGSSPGGAGAEPRRSVRAHEKQHAARHLPLRRWRRARRVAVRRRHGALFDGRYSTPDRLRAVLGPSVLRAGAAAAHAAAQRQRRSAAASADDHSLVCVVSAATAPATPVGRASDGWQKLVSSAAPRRHLSAELPAAAVCAAADRTVRSATVRDPYYDGACMRLVQH